MTVRRTEIETALNELISNEEGMRFQGLAVALGKQRWPQLIACQRKKDLGLDAYVPSSQTPENVRKGLAASITTTLRKVSDDAKTAKKNYPDLRSLLFVTPNKVDNSKREHWEDAIRNNHGLELLLIEREDIITELMIPKNASLCASFLYLDIEAEPDFADLIDRTRCAADVANEYWSAKTKGHPLVELTAMRFDPSGAAESAEVLSLDQIDQALSQSGRIVLEGPAGRGKTTTLIQLAQRPRTTGIPFIVQLPAWTASRQKILDYIAGMPAFLAEGLTSAHLARVQQTEPFLFLLNGWNEITESNSSQADVALEELERDLPSAGIIVATRTHHLMPTLSGALRLKLLRLGRGERADYLSARLGGRSADLQLRIDSDPSLKELTRTPFILSEVASLFEADAEIPTTKIGILSVALRLHEERHEHRNSLQEAPIFGRQVDFLMALANEMTRRGAVALSDADAREVIATITKDLGSRGQIERSGAPTILTILTAHHLLERVDYPEIVFQFEHQQFQEHYAALGVRARLFDLSDDDQDVIGRFTADYVNATAWTEPLRMLAEVVAEQTGDEGAVRQSIDAGVKLVKMALAVDLVFAGELVQLCGLAVWNEVREAVGERLRAAHAISDGNYQQYAIAAMLATGKDEFSDIILPLLSGDDQQARLRTLRIWPDIQLSSLGSTWREKVRGWREDARNNFVFELLHHRVDDEIACFAAEDNSTGVKMAAISGLIWTGSEDALIRVLESMDSQTFEDAVCKYADCIPSAFKPKAIEAMREFIKRKANHASRLRTALDLIAIGESGFDGVVRDALAALSSGDDLKSDLRIIRLALEYLRDADPAWTSEWVVTQVAEGNLYGHEDWKPFVTVIPNDLVNVYLRRLATEDLRNAHFQGLIAVIAFLADANLASKVFAELRELRRKVDAEPGQRHELEFQVMRQLEAVFRELPHNIIASGILSSVNNGDPLDIKLAAGLLSSVARNDLELLCITDEVLKEQLRAYFKGSIGLVLGQDDFKGEEKANLASSISQVGEPEDMADLMTLIRSDIGRVRRGWAALAAGDHWPLGNGCRITYAGRHIAGIMQLDPAGAEQVLIDLLPEPEYRSEVAGAMARNFMPKTERSFGRQFRYDLMWAAREGDSPSFGDNQRRTRFVAALKNEIEHLREQAEDVNRTGHLKMLANALAVIDGPVSAELVIDIISIPGQWDEYICLAAARRLLIAGVELPATTTFALVDTIMERTRDWMDESDRNLLRQVLVLCPFVDNPPAGIEKMRDVLGKRWFAGYELREVVTALGESRSDAAIDLLCKLASDARTFADCEEDFYNAFAALDKPRTHELLLGFVDPDVGDVALPHSLYREDVLIARITELAQRIPEIAARLRELCERDLPEINRHVLSRVLTRLGTPQAFLANLNLINDAKPLPVPQGVRDQLKNAFVERRPYGQNSNIFTMHARTSNELRKRLFKMAHEDSNRRKSAFTLLGQLEVWRLEYGRPLDEPRHPDLASGRHWPPKELTGDGMHTVSGL